MNHIKNIFVNKLTFVATILVAISWVMNFYLIFIDHNIFTIISILILLIVSPLSKKEIKELLEDKNIKFNWLLISISNFTAPFVYFTLAKNQPKKMQKK